VRVFDLGSCFLRAWCVYMLFISFLINVTPSAQQLSNKLKQHQHRLPFISCFFLNDCCFDNRKHSQNFGPALKSTHLEQLVIFKIGAASRRFCMWGARRQVKQSLGSEVAFESVAWGLKKLFLVAVCKCLQNPVLVAPGNWSYGQFPSCSSATFNIMITHQVVSVQCQS
jgi:hypothetical protein